MKTIILFGLPGTGKRTVSEELEKLTGIPFLHNHDILDVVRKFLPRPSPQGIFLAREFRRLLFVNMMDANCPGIITSIAGGSPGVLAWIQQMTQDIEERGGEVYFVELRCNYETLLQRINTPERQKGGKLRTKVELDEFLQKDYFRGLPTHPQLFIDTTEFSAVDTAKFIKEKLLL